MKRDLAVIAGVAALAFWPYLLRGDVIFEPGAAWHAIPYEGGPPPGARQEPDTTDFFAMAYPYMRFYGNELHQGRFGLWNPYLQCGAPTDASGVSPVLSPLTYPLMRLLSHHEAIHLSAMARAAFGGMALYALACALGASRPGALLGAIVWSIWGVTTQWRLIPWHGAFVLFLPLELWLLARARAGGSYAWLGLAIGGDILSSSLPASLVNLAVVGGAALWLSRDRRHLAVTAAAIAGGVLVGAPKLVPFLAAQEHLTQMPGQLAQGGPPWQPLVQLSSMLFPRGLGGVMEQTNLHPMLGTRAIGGSLYVGTAGVLAVLAALRRRRAWALAAVSAGLAILIALKPVLSIVSLLPVVERIGVGYLYPPQMLGLSLLVAFGAHRLLLMEAFHRALLRWAKVATLSIAALLAAFSAVHALAEELPHAAARFFWWFGLHNDAFGWPIAALALLLLVLPRLRRRHRTRLLIGMTALELAFFMHRVNPFCPREQVFAPSGLTAAAATDGRTLYKRPFDFWYSDPPNLPMAYDIQTPQMYEATRPRYVPELAAAAAGSFKPIETRNTAVNPSNEPLLRLLQVKRVVRLHGTRFVARDVVGVPPRAFVVHRSDVIADREARLKALVRPDFPIGERVVLEEGAPADGDGTGTARIVEARADRVVVRAQTDAPGTLVLLDAWFPGWEATVNGKPARVLKADHAFRAVPLPEAGTFTVEFAYRPRSLRWGFYAAGGGALLLLVWLLWCFGPIRT
jgi:hypothetical protein